MQHASGSPCRDRCQYHDSTMRQVEDAGDAEDQGEASRAQRKKRANGEAGDQSLKGKDLQRRGITGRHWRTEQAKCPRATREHYHRGCQFAVTLTKLGNFNWPLATSFGQTLVCLPSCHCSIRPVIRPLPYFRPWVNWSSLP